MNHAGRARIDHHVEAVTEREERVRRHDRTGQGQAGVLRLDRGDAGRVDAAHLAGAHAQGHVVATEDDGVRFDILGHAPREHQVLQLLRRRLQFRDHFQVADQHVFRVGRLHQQAATDALEVHGIDAIAQRNFQQAHVLLGRQDLLGFSGKHWRDQHFDEQLGQFHGSSRIDFHVEGDDAAECRGRIGLQRALVSVGSVGAQGHAARVGVLDDHARGALVEAAHALHAFPCSIGVGDIVERQFLALQLAVVGQRAWRSDDITVERG